MAKNSHSYSISQNYLTGTRLIQRLLALTDLSSNDQVLDIGAGKGHLTRALAERCGRVTAIEIDPALSQALTKHFAGNPTVCVRQQDFLCAPLPKGDYKVFSNIPFCHTTEIVRKLLLGPNGPKAAWLVMEKGAAKRIAGIPATNTLSLQLSARYDLRIVYHFSRGDFHPAPSVDCVLLAAIEKQQPDMPPSQLPKFGQFIENVKWYGLSRYLTKKQVSTALRLAGLPSIPESANMLYVQWLCLFRCYCRFSGR